MMEELKKNGPFVVSFESDINFIYYKSGIYHSVENIDAIENFETIDNNNSFFRKEWTKIDHSVLLVGWGILYLLYFY